MTDMLGVVVPQPIQFLNWGWWVIHAIGITLVFMIGMAVAKKCCKAKP